MKDATPAVRARHRLHALLQNFDAALAAENDALRRRDPEGLRLTVEAKQRLAGDLEQLAPHVKAPDGSDAEARDLAQWNEIQHLLSRCALVNRTNGAAIEASRAFVNSLLDLMIGRRPVERTYTASGRMETGGSQLRYERV
jgi:flagellar biosynthesis/type III secretory pathway chaperone